jgi:hypothetical protein
MQEMLSAAEDEDPSYILLTLPEIVILVGPHQ